MQTKDSKTAIRDFALEIGADDIGFAAPDRYHSPKSYPLEHFFSTPRTLIVLIFKELSSCESPSATIAMNGRLDMNAHERQVSYRLCRFLERQYDAKVAPMPYSSPMELHKDRLGIADFSQRHAAVAAGLGSFGRHNLVIHPVFGTRIGISTIIADLVVPADAPITEDLCIRCNLCVAQCPAHALDEEEKTDVSKCVARSQPYGLRANISFWSKAAEKSSEEQKDMFRDEQYWRIQQASSIGMQYACFHCMQICPVGKTQR